MVKGRRRKRPKKHRHKKKTVHKGRQGIEAYKGIIPTYISKPGPDWRVAAVERPKRRPELIKNAEKLEVLFDKNFVQSFRKNLEFWRGKPMPGVSKRGIEISCINNALLDTFRHRIPNVGELYNKFSRETKKYSFTDFQRWAKQLIKLAKGPWQDSR